MLCRTQTCLSMQQAIVAEIEAEQALVAANRERMPASRKRSKTRLRGFGEKKRSMP